MLFQKVHTGFVSISFCMCNFQEALGTCNSNLSQLELQEVSKSKNQTQSVSKVGHSKIEANKINSHFENLISHEEIRSLVFED